MKKITFLILMTFCLVSCEKEGFINQIDTSHELSTSFPKEIPLQEFVSLTFSAKFGKSEKFKEIKFVNESEAYIKTFDNRLQYYKIDEKNDVMTSIDNFSGKVIDFKKLENLKSKENAANEVCSFTDGDCSTTVETYYVVMIKVTFTCGDVTLDPTYLPIGLVGLACTAGWLTNNL